jgi:hypothetical protein
MGRKGLLMQKRDLVVKIRKTYHRPNVSFSSVHFAPAGILVGLQMMCQYPTEAEAG